LRLIYQFLSKDVKNSEELPVTYLCYKSRHEEIDEKIVSTFEELGFTGE